MNAAGFYLLLLLAVYINLHPECKIPCSNDFRDKQGKVKLMVGHCAQYHTG